MGKIAEMTATDSLKLPPAVAPRFGASDRPTLGPPNTKPPAHRWGLRVLCPWTSYSCASSSTSVTWAWKLWPEA